MNHICDACGFRRYTTIKLSGSACGVCGDGVLRLESEPPVAPEPVVPPVVPEPVASLPPPAPHAQQVIARKVTAEAPEKVIRINRKYQVFEIQGDRPLARIWERVAQRAQALDDLGASSSGDVVRRLLDDLVQEFGK